MADRENNFMQDDFKLVQRDERITDQKLETKPTTFFRDALRRFRKNKSSVAGAVILFILIFLAIVVPWLSPHNITTVRTAEKFLAPKLFDAGTGFWDGTRKMQRIIYDTVNEVPALSNKQDDPDAAKYTPAAIKDAMVSLTVDKEPSMIDTINSYGTGGVVVLATDAAVEGKDVFMTSQPFGATDAEGLRLDIALDEEEYVSDSLLGEYRVTVSFGDGPDDSLLVRDFSRDYSPISFDVSAAMKEKGIASGKARIVFDVKATGDALRYILLKSVVLSAEKPSDPDTLAAVSFDNPTAMVAISDIKSPAYWPCTGRKGIHNSVVWLCDYTIDTYRLVYSDADPVTYDVTQLNNWIAQGWCTYDADVGPESFEKLSEDCPIDRVVDQTIIKRSKKLSSIKGVGFKYKLMGYKEMPRFLLGTDVSGFDLFKRAFAGLRTSLILGVCTAAFCFIFGLIWGSISGYFGGNVDLFMERFCEILSGVPWIVIMTLCILHLGNNFVTFFLALCMTGWMGTAGRTRTQFYRFKGREYVLASRTLGSSDMRLIFKHILPNSMGTIITSSVLMIPSVIFSEATLAYLNLGLQGSQSFGVMMSANQQYLSIYPNLVIFPAIIIALMMISFNLFGNGLRDAFNPSLKGSE